MDPVQVVAAWQGLNRAETPEGLYLRHQYPRVWTDWLQVLLSHDAFKNKPHPLSVNLQHLTYLAEIPGQSHVWQRLFFPLAGLR